MARTSRKASGGTAVCCCGRRRRRRRLRRVREAGPRRRRPGRAAGRLARDGGRPPPPPLLVELRRALVGLFVAENLRAVDVVLGLRGDRGASVMAGLGGLKPASTRSGKPVDTFRGLLGIRRGALARASLLRCAWVAVCAVLRPRLCRAPRVRVWLLSRARREAYASLFRAAGCTRVASALSSQPSLCERTQIEGKRTLLSQIRIGRASVFTPLAFI